MDFIYDSFTLTGIISVACTIIVVLFVVDCCRIRHKLTQKLGK